MPKNQYPTATAYAFQLQCELILSHIRMAINFLQSEIVTVYEKNLFEKFSLLLVPGWKQQKDSSVCVWGNHYYYWDDATFLCFT